MPVFCCLYLPVELVSLLSGAYLGGGHWAMAPPLGRQDSIISLEQYAKLWHAPPPFVSWAEALSTQRVDEDVCFRPATNFGQLL